MAERTNQAAQGPSFLVWSLKYWKHLEIQRSIWNNTAWKRVSCPCAGGSYFKCDHQRSVFLYLETLNGTCASRTFPCTSYKEFLEGNCLNCDQFGAAGCPVFGWYFNYLLEMKNMHCFGFHSSKLCLNLMDSHENRLTRIFTWVEHNIEQYCQWKNSWDYVMYHYFCRIYSG